MRLLLALPPSMLALFIGYLIRSGVQILEHGAPLRPRCEDNRYYEP
jgi:hypothetical protein